MTDKRDTPTPPDQYELLLACYRSGQVSERQWQQYLKDPEFRAWLERNDNGRQQQD